VAVSDNAPDRVNVVAPGTTDTGIAKWSFARIFLSSFRLVDGIHSGSAAPGQAWLHFDEYPNLPEFPASLRITTAQRQDRYS
jgi:hypothetical protein